MEIIKKLNPPPFWDPNKNFHGISAQKLLELGNGYAVTLEYFQKFYKNEWYILHQFLLSNNLPWLSEEYKNNKNIKDYFYIEISSHPNFPNMFTMTNSGFKFVYLNGNVFCGHDGYVWEYNKNGEFVEITK